MELGDFTRTHGKVSEKAHHGFFLHIIWKGAERKRGINMNNASI